MSMTHEEARKLIEASIKPRKEDGVYLADTYDPEFFKGFRESKPAYGLGYNDCLRDVLKLFTEKGGI